MTTSAPVTVPPRLFLELLDASTPRPIPNPPLRVVRCRGLRRSGQNTTILCPCDHGGGNCLTSVRLEYRRFLLEGWLLTELYVGDCPHCRRIYWG